MADVDPDAIDSFAEWCAGMALVFREYRSDLDGRSEQTGGLAGGRYPAEPGGSIEALSDGTDFAFEKLELGDMVYPERNPPPGVDLGASPGAPGVSPWAHAMAQEWNMGVMGRITDLERAYDELERLADDLHDIAQNWRDADGAAASEIERQHSNVDYHDRDW